jgi:hypothetical protein
MIATGPAAEEPNFGSHHLGLAELDEVLDLWRDVSSGRHRKMGVTAVTL